MCVSEQTINLLANDRLVINELLLALLQENTDAAETVVTAIFPETEAANGEEIQAA
jgi:hypothetical protein